MKVRKHKVLDHPILGYALLCIFVMLVSEIFSTFIDQMILAPLIPGYGTVVEMYGQKVMSASGAGTAIGAVVCVIIFWLWFRPAFDGMLKGKELLKGLLLLLPFLVFHWAGSVVSLIQLGTASVSIAFLRALAPGFMEEIAFRGLGVANYMRTKNNEKGVMKIFWISSIVFGFIHMTNVLAGAPLLTSLIQSVYAAGVGMAFAAVYLKTGNLWPTIIGHASVDFLEFIRADLGASGGVMGGMGLGDWITIAAGVFAAVWALYLMRKSCRQQIVDLWNGKWKTEVAQEPAE